MNSNSFEINDCILDLKSIIFKKRFWSELSSWMMQMMKNKNWSWFGKLNATNEFIVGEKDEDEQKKKTDNS